MLCCCVCLWVVRERNAVPHTSHQGTLGVWVHKHTFSWLLAVSDALLVVAGYGGEVAAIGTPAVAAGRNGCVYFPQDQPTHAGMLFIVGCTCFAPAAQYGHTCVIVCCTRAMLVGCAVQ